MNVYYHNDKRAVILAPIKMLGFNEDYSYFPFASTRRGLHSQIQSLFLHYKLRD